MFGERLKRKTAVHPHMPQSAREEEQGPVPWPQQLLDSIWLLAGLAIVFWALSYIVWGLIDLMSVPSG